MDDSDYKDTHSANELRDGVNTAATGALVFISIYSWKQARRAISSSSNSTGRRRRRDTSSMNDHRSVRILSIIPVVRWYYLWFLSWKEDYWLPLHLPVPPCSSTMRWALKSTLNSRSGSRPSRLASNLSLRSSTGEPSSTAIWPASHSTTRTVEKHTKWVWISSPFTPRLSFHSASWAWGKYR